MILLTAEDAKALDQTAQQRFGISVLALMENAGAAVARQALRMSRKRQIAVFCGKGNNGGDGFVCCRHLLAAGVTPKLFLACPAAQLRNEAKINLDILRKLSLPFKELTQDDLPAVDRSLAGFDLVIDALLGVGLRGDVEGIYKQLIHSINNSRRPVLAVDIPSGLDATTGKVLGAAVKADTTVTFVAKKQGMVIKEGPRHCGKVVISDLGIPLG
jgi:NAD(P)H-hydrate epimerase